MTHVIGRQISHFYIIRTLGAGGMGVVYEAQDTRLPRSVAIKVLKEELSKNVDAIRRFKREARLASSLNHPNICTILEVSEDESQSFIAMELLEGTSLKSRLLGGPAVARRDRRYHEPGRRRAGRGARPGHHSSRHHAGQYFPHRWRTREAPGLRAGQALSDVRRGRSDHRRPDQLRRRRRNDSLYVTRAVGGARLGRLPVRLLCAWCRAVSDGHRRAVRSTSCRGTRSARPSRPSRTCRCGSWRRTIRCNWSASSTRCSRSVPTIGTSRPARCAPSSTPCTRGMKAATPGAESTEPAPLGGGAAVRYRSARPTRTPSR